MSSILPNAVQQTRPRKRQLALSPLLLRVKSGLFVRPRAFEKLCTWNRDLRLERTARGELIVMAPAGSGSGNRNSRLTARLDIWAERDGTGLCFDSSSGFTLPNGAIRSPDASWVVRERWNALGPEDQERFAPICPDFVVELRSRSDQIKDLCDKMHEYIDQGARLGWMIDPLREIVEIYRPGKPVETLNRPMMLSGEDVLPGFILELKDILFS